MSTASVPLHHLELPIELGSDYGRHDFEDVVRSDLAHGFEIVAVNADELPAFVERLGEDYFQGPRIGIWGWETNAHSQRAGSARSRWSTRSGCTRVHGREHRSGRAGAR